ncbi:pentatricopeptide repeat-containing protein [Planoprotostelium fungivorum]|uniref:Pentatricopeptide repeat-containing protein n=1 Tax=Planoprotostelium fungivorum TaxID=1890364 RepID=A0A2P6N3E1_9EUKA|nr:pentatricopeptide repeat-containing protein [Planoprotostelium fungivorum]
MYPSLHPKKKLQKNLMIRITSSRSGIFIQTCHKRLQKSQIQQLSHVTISTAPLRSSSATPICRTYHQQLPRPTHTFEGHSLDFSKRSSYNAELERAAHGSDPDRVIEILRRMEEDCIAQDRATFDILLKFYSRRGDEASMLECLRSMRDKKLWPNAHTFNTIIKHFSRKGDTKGMESWYSKMERERIHKPNKMTFDLILKHYCDRGDATGVESCLQRMNQAAIAYDVATYDILMELPHKENDLPSAMSLLEELRGKGMKPNFHMYRKIIAMKLSAGDNEGATQMLQNMKEDGIEPDGRLLSLMEEKLERKDSGSAAIWQRK